MIQRDAARHWGMNTKCMPSTPLSLSLSLALSLSLSLSLTHTFSLALSLNPPLNLPALDSFQPHSHLSSGSDWQKFPENSTLRPCHPKDFREHIRTRVGNFSSVRIGNWSRYARAFGQDVICSLLSPIRNRHSSAQWQILTSLKPRHPGQIQTPRPEARGPRTETRNP